MAKIYSIYDRRTTDEISERTIDEAIKKYIKDSDNIALETYSEVDKTILLSEAGFSIRELPAIGTTFHTSSKNVPDVEHIQLDFNFAEESKVFDFHMEEYNGKKYLCIEFFGVDPGMRCERMFDDSGTEKCIEWCSSCEEEVVLDAVLHKDQVCPSCGEPIKACHLCSDCRMQCTNDDKK